MPTFGCALYCNFDAIYSAQQPFCAMWIVVPTIYNVVTSARIQSSVFNWTYLRSYWRHLDNWMRVILRTWSQIQRTSSRLRFVNCGPGHIQWNGNTAYSAFNIQLNVSKLLLEISRQFKERYTANLVPNTAHIIQFTLCELWSRTYAMHLQLHIFRLQNSTESICAAIGDTPTFRCNILQIGCQI
jgi:hypothetical protein